MNHNQYTIRVELRERQPCPHCTEKDKRIAEMKAGMIKAIHDVFGGDE